MAPNTTGISFTIPLPQIEQAIATASETKASTQLLLAMFTPVPARDRPMRMITGPMTMGGNSFFITLMPNSLTTKLISI